MKYRKVLVIGGTHGDECTGIRVVQHLEKSKQKFLVSLIANPYAVKRSVRYVETDLNRSAGKQLAVSYEEQQVTKLAPFIRRADIVIEFHNTTAVSNTCGIITMPPTRLHYALAVHFGLTRLVIMPPEGSLSGLASRKFLSLEISNKDNELNNVSYLCSKLAVVPCVRAMAQGNIAVYLYTGATITKRTLARKGVSVALFKNFEPISPQLCVALSLPKNRQFFSVFMGEQAYGATFAFQILERLE